MRWRTRLAGGMQPCSAGRSLFTWILLILSTVDVQSVAARGHHHRSSLRRIQLRGSIESLIMFTCKKPQARAYNLKELMENVPQNPGDSASQPVYLVLQRCDGHSGCCTSMDKSCAPVESSVYYEEMEIEIWSLETNTTKRRWIRVEQHGQCACKVNTAEDRYNLANQLPIVTWV